MLSRLPRASRVHLESTQEARAARGVTLSLLSCSPDFPRASITRSTHSQKSMNQFLTVVLRDLSGTFGLFFHANFQTAVCTYNASCSKKFASIRNLATLLSLNYKQYCFINDIGNLKKRAPNCSFCWNICWEETRTSEIRIKL